MWWLIIIPGIIVIFVAVIIIRALLFKPPAKEAIAIDDVAVDAESAAGRLARMIRCKTVSNRDGQLVDNNEFEKFRRLLAELYPNVHGACKCERIGPSGVLYTLKGKSSDAPVVFMSHYDVVPADEAAWEKPPFEGILEDGFVWGRGTLDTKSTLCSILEAAECLIPGGFIPENDVYFAFGGDEEVTGESAPSMVDEFQKRGVVPALVLDEGGAVVEGMFPGVPQPCALIGTAEKGFLDVRLSVSGKGGHASSPPPHTPVGILARAVTRIENKPFKAKLTLPVAAMFDTLGRHSTFVYKLIFSNLWCFKPLLDIMCRRSGGELNAMMRTTCAFTMMEGSSATNVLPHAASMVANLRLMDGETIGGAIAHLKSLAKDADIEFSEIFGINPSKNSFTSGTSWDKLREVVAQTWPDAIISPYLMVACSDSKHYCRISDHVYRFSAMALSKEERETIHGHNERIPVNTLEKAIQFYTRLMRRC